jgi:hypothetical protein
VGRDDRSLHKHFGEVRETGGGDPMKSTLSFLLVSSFLASVAAAHAQMAMMSD